MVDVETSGLDPHTDQLLAIAGVAVRVDWTGKTLSIIPGDSFEVVVRNDASSSTDNILLHGIGAQAQSQGQNADLALAGFARFVSDSPLAAFHAAFDELILSKAHQLAGLGVPLNPWIDIAELCRVCWPDTGNRSLDQWMEHLSLSCPQRHQAAADAWVEAEVLQMLWPKVAQACNRFSQAQAFAAQSRWLR